MEYINAGVLCHSFFGEGESVQQERIKLLVSHIIILDFARRSLVVHIVRGIGHHEIGMVAVHEQIDGLGFGAVAADQAVLTQQPQVASLGDGGVLQFTVHIEIIILHIFIAGQQFIKLGIVKAKQSDIKIRALQIGNFH